jgi:hypothetical protein
MRVYAIDGAQTVTSPTDSVLGLTSTAAIRPKIILAILGSLATPADNALQFLFQRYTAAGTATSVTPTALDPGDPAATAAAGENHSAEPTYTADAVLLNVPLNQRATYTAYLDQTPLVLPATAANGVGIQPVHASFTGDVTATLHYGE